MRRRSPLYAIVGYNGSLAAGAGTPFGFIGSSSGSNGIPSVSCTAN